jgi:hypothetical protein
MAGGAWPNRRVKVKLVFIPAAVKNAVFSLLHQPPSNLV